MKLQPLQSNILCSVHEGRGSVLQLPDGAELQPYAKVLSLGPDCKFLKVGDQVLFHPASAIFADKIDDEKIVMCNESAVFAKYIESDPIPNN